MIKMKKLVKRFKESSFAESFNFKNIFFNSLLYDFINYAGTISLFLVFFLSTDKSFAILKAFENDPQITDAAISTISSVMEGLKIYFAVIFVIAVISWLFWRAKILSFLFGRKEKFKKTAAAALAIGFYKVILIGFASLIAALILQSFNENASRIMVTILMLLFLYAYVCFIFGISAKEKWKERFGAAGKLFSSPLNIFGAIIASYMVLAALLFLNSFLQNFNESVYVAIGIVTIFLFLNWARYYMFLVSKSAIENTKH